MPSGTRPPSILVEGLDPQRFRLGKIRRYGIQDRRCSRNQISAEFRSSGKPYNKVKLVLEQDCVLVDGQDPAQLGYLHELNV